MEIIYQDDWLVLVNKPSMLLSVPGRGEDKRDSVVYRLQQHFAWVREVHRLDWETSGLLLLALHPDSHRQLSAQFAQREVDKRYQALVYGRLEQPQGEITLPLRCDWPNRPRQMVDLAHGKPAHTRWQCLDQYANYSRVALYPLTGRSHQLRVHMLSIGHPILGDRLYGDQTVQAMAPRLMLHAEYLAFTHPGDGQRREFFCPAMFTVPF